LKHLTINIFFTNFNDLHLYINNQGFW